MEAVTFHNMDQVLTRIVMVVVLVRAKHKKHTRPTVKVMLLLQVWVVLPFLNIQLSLPAQNPSGVPKHNKSFLHLTMVLPLQAMLLQLLCQVNPLITNNLLYTHQQHWKEIVIKFLKLVGLGEAMLQMRQRNKKLKWHKSVNNKKVKISKKKGRFRVNQVMTMGMKLRSPKLNRLRLPKSTIYSISDNKNLLQQHLHLILFPNQQNLLRLSQFNY